jgi:hypothetical protein
MNHTLQKAIIEYMLEHRDEFGTLNATIKEFKLYIYDQEGSYLIGGAQVANFIGKFDTLLTEVES